MSWRAVRSSPRTSLGQTSRRAARNTATSSLNLVLSFLTRPLPLATSTPHSPPRGRHLVAREFCAIPRCCQHESGFQPQASCTHRAILPSGTGESSFARLSLNPTRRPSQWASPPALFGDCPARRLALCWWRGGGAWQESFRKPHNLPLRHTCASRATRAAEERGTEGVGETGRVEEGT